MAQGTQLTGSVGAGGRNKPINVAEVEYLLRRSAPDPFEIAIDGVAGPDLLTGIVDFQTRTLNQDDPSGLIKPRDAAARQLSSSQGTGQVAIEAIRAMVPNDVDMQASRVGDFTGLYGRQYGAIPSGLVQFFVLVANNQRIQDLRWFAYFLATCWWETAHTFQPVRERGPGRGPQLRDADAVQGQVGPAIRQRLLRPGLRTADMARQLQADGPAPRWGRCSNSIRTRPWTRRWPTASCPSGSGRAFRLAVRPIAPARPSARQEDGPRLPDPGQARRLHHRGQCDYYHARLCVNPYDTNSFTTIARRP